MYLININIALSDKAAIMHETKTNMLMVNVVFILMLYFELIQLSYQLLNLKRKNKY